ncbi:MAG: ChrR family anti-sigma-E factor [Inquilinaceae bacterium]
MTDLQAIELPMPSHHPEESLLVDYATGATNEAEALILAAHLTLCPSCRASVARFEGLGGAMMDSMVPADMASDALQAALARIDTAPDDGRPSREPAVADTRRAEGPATFPTPLRRYVGGDAGQVKWRSVMRGLDECELDVGGGHVKAKLLRIAAGAAMPKHTHAGNEMTLVLTGGFVDERGHFARGDMAVHDSAVDHRPVADPDDDCICLAVTDGPLRLTGALGRFLNPFVRY